MKGKSRIWMKSIPFGNEVLETDQTFRKEIMPKLDISSAGPASRRFLPPLTLIAAFECAARLGSITAAAQELALSQGAVSRQIAQLERQLGVALFARVRKRIVLTEAGRFYAEEMRQLLARFASVTAETIAFRGEGGTLDLAILPTFGTRWLIPRMPEFFAAHRDVTINFSTRVRPFDFRREGLQAAIHFGDPVWPGGAEMHLLMGERLIPVAAPSLVERAGIAGPDDVEGQTLLVQATRPNAWDEWFGARGLEPRSGQQRLAFEQFALVLRAAAAGLGLALVPEVLARDELAAGEVVPLFGAPIESRQGYYLAYPPENRDLPALVAFRNWLLAATAADRSADQPAE
jgi:LysR family glycine cleavage system transcriptional activator